MSKNLTLMAVALAMLSMVAMPSRAHAQSADELMGAWEYVSGTTTIAGKTTYTFGQNPQGRLILDKAGNWTAVIMRGDLPQFASKDRMAGTPDEYKGIGQGILAYFGKYTVDPAQRVITVKILSASFPNWNGQTQTRNYEVVGDTLTITARGIDGGVGKIVWKRMAQK